MVPETQRVRLLPLSVRALADHTSLLSRIASSDWPARATRRPIGRGDQEVAVDVDAVGGSTPPLPSEALPDNPVAIRV